MEYIGTGLNYDAPFHLRLDDVEMTLHESTQLGFFSEIFLIGTSNRKFLP